MNKLQVLILEKTLLKTAQDSTKTYTALCAAKAAQDSTLIIKLEEKLLVLAASAEKTYEKLILIRRS